MELLAMIRRTVTASALFLALSASGGDPLGDVIDRREDSGQSMVLGKHRQHAIDMIAGWTMRWEGLRCWMATPERGEHQALWFRPGTDVAAGDPRSLLQGFMAQFTACASSSSMLAGIPAERVIGRGCSLHGDPQIGIAVLAPTPTGTLILASRGIDADLPGRFLDLLAFSRLV
jgi:hypothetical protein